MTTTHLTGTMLVQKATLSGQGTMLGPREIEITATTGVVDLMDDEVVPQGMTPGTCNVPVFLNHQASGNNIPIGRAYLRTSAVAVVGKIVFAPEGDSDLADQVCRACKSGLFDAVSIGFTPVKTSRRPGGRGVKYETWVCNELSVVGVGANPQARVTARAHDADRAERRAKAARVGREGRMQQARAYALDNGVQLDAAPLTKADRVARAAALAARGEELGVRPAAPMTLREAYVQSQADYANAVRAHLRDRHPDKASRMVRAAKLNPRLAGY